MTRLAGLNLWQLAIVLLGLGLAIGLSVWMLVWVLWMTRELLALGAALAAEGCALLAIRRRRRQWSTRDWVGS